MVRQCRPRHYEGPFESPMTRREAALILGVRETATAKRIKDAHRRMTLINHRPRGSRLDRQGQRGEGDAHEGPGYQLLRDASRVDAMLLASSRPPSSPPPRGLRVVGQRRRLVPRVFINEHGRVELRLVDGCMARAMLPCVGRPTPAVTHGRAHAVG